MFEQFLIHLRADFLYSIRITEINLKFILVIKHDKEQESNDNKRYELIGQIK